MGESNYLRVLFLNSLAFIISFELKDVQTVLSILLLIVSIIYTIIKIVKESRSGK